MRANELPCTMSFWTEAQLVVAKTVLSDDILSFIDCFVDEDYQDSTDGNRLILSALVIRLWSGRDFR